MRVSTELGDAATPGSGGSEGPIHPLIDLYRLYERQLFRQCLSQLRNPSDAEDAVQETFARAARHLEQLEEDPEPYLATVARNVCRDEMQRRARCISSGDPAMFGEIEVGHPETSTIDRDQLNAAWKRFTQRERQLIGRQFAGFSYDEIAGHLKMTPGALTVALARARKRARQVASVSANGLVALLGLRRLVGRTARNGGGTVAMPSALMAATAVTCVVVGVAGGNWLASQPGRAAVVAAPSSLSSAAQDLGARSAPAVSTADRTAGSAAVSSVSGPPAAAPPQLEGVASSVISPGTNATQEDTAFSAITPSPSYQQDHTVFASGTLANGCGRPTCPVLFWTRDGGSTWQHLTANGFLGGKLLLPSSYPADPTMFAAGPAGLQRSDDGGASFHTVVPGVAPAAIDPTSAVGAARVFIAAQVPLIYEAATGMVHAGPALPVGITAPLDVEYGSGRDVIVTANQADPAANSLQDGVVVVCPNEQACRVTLLDASQPVLNLDTSPSTGTAFVWSSAGVRVSRDGGASFAALALPSARQIHAVAMATDFGSSPRLVVAEAAGGGGGDQLAQSSNGGASFASVAPAGLAQAMALSLVVLPDGHEIAAVSEPAAMAGFGIRCSANGGVSWALAC